MSQIAKSAQYKPDWLIGYFVGLRALSTQYQVCYVVKWSDDKMIAFARCMGLANRE